MILCIKEILTAVDGKLLKGSLENNINEISIDSREISGDSLFIPIQGERFDGHDFINDAINNGANSFLISKDMDITKYKNKTIIFVNDTLKALHDLSRLILEKYNIPVIAVTGSTGKTTTKEFVYNVLSQKYNVLKNKGNYNNHIGLPLTIFNCNSKTEIAVLEMGMSGRGEIDLLANITRPKISIITNIGTSHIEKLGSQEEIYNAKMEITNYMDQSESLICNGDDQFLKALKNKYTKFEKVFIGLNEDNDIYAQNIVNIGYAGMEFDMYDGNEVHSFKLDVPGVHNVYNALIAVAVGKIHNISIEDIKAGLKLYSGSKMRLNIIEKEDIIIINDCYNSSPDSMNAALKVLKEINTPRKIAILGDMLEMGGFSEAYHKEVGNMVREYNVDLLITVGKEAKNIAKGALEMGLEQDQVHSFDNNNGVINFIKNTLKYKDSILIKGSRGMKMEQIVQFLQERG